jgi:hypothetical protein
VACSVKPEVTWLETPESVSAPVYPGAESGAVRVPEELTGSVVELTNGVVVAGAAGVVLDPPPPPHAATTAAVTKARRVSKSPLRCGIKVLAARADQSAQRLSAKTAN